VDGYWISLKLSGNTHDKNGLVLDQLVERDNLRGDGELMAHCGGVAMAALERAVCG
jgi:hypothetical protein